MHRQLIEEVEVPGRIAVIADMAFRQRGRMDARINGAGILTSFSILDAQEAEIDRLLATNLKGRYWGCAAAGRAMKPWGGGSIVNISSAADSCQRRQKWSGWIGRCKPTAGSPAAIFSNGW